MWKAMGIVLLLFCATARGGLYDDPEFGNGGYVDVEYAGALNFCSSPKLVVLPDSRVVVVAMQSHPTAQLPVLEVVRLLPDGRPDAAFGTNGRATVALATQPIDWGYATGLVPLSDGGLLILSYTMRVEVPPGGADPIYHEESQLLRLRVDGSVDPAFNGGYAWTGVGRFSRSHVFVQNDGLLLVTTNPYCCYGNSGFEALRLRPDGALDVAFGLGGMLNVPGSGSDSVDAMVLAGSGFQILHYKMPANGQPARNFWRRYRADGSVDTAFGAGGDQEIPLVEASGMTQLHVLGDGTVLGTGATCPLRRFDAEGRVLAVLSDCTRTGSSNFRVQRYGGKWLFSGEQRFGGVPPPSDGTYLHVTDHSGRVDGAFAAPQGTRWRPPDDGW